MERFWRTQRAACIDHLGAVASLHDVQARLAFLDGHYHVTLHGGLLGKPPPRRGRARCTPVDEARRAAVLTVRVRRRVRRDGTVDAGGRASQIDQGLLAGRVVTVALDHTGAASPVVEHYGQTYRLRPVDSVAASRTRRTRSAARTAPPNVPFDPAGALLDRALAPARGC